jgi:hypothetical protein
MNNTTKVWNQRLKKYAFVEFIYSSNIVCAIGQVGTIKLAIIDCPCIQSKHQGVFYSKYGTLFFAHNGGISCELKICVSYTSLHNYNPISPKINAHFQFNLDGVRTN